MTLKNVNEVSTIMQVVIALVASLLGQAVLFYLAKYRVWDQPRGDKTMVKLADDIKTGARAFLEKEYKYMAVFVFCFFFVVGAVTKDWIKTGVSFFLGAALSALCGWLGMSMAVEANVRTAEAAKKGLKEALQVAFASGGCMGLGVVTTGLLGLITVFGIWGGERQSQTAYLAGFGFGASSIALFARVGGGIYTKAADVGADLVGKVESGIPEDDPRNPATIADNVGDNVGDVAGMGADLFESFVGSIIASIQLAENGRGFFVKRSDFKDDDFDYSDSLSAFIALPFWVAGFGLLSSMVGIFLVKTDANPRPDELQDVLLRTIRIGISTASILSWLLSLVSCVVLFGFSNTVSYELWGCISIGLVCGEAIGFSTEYATSFAYSPTKSIAKKSRIGSAPLVIQGLGIGMLSTAAPVGFIFIAILSTYELGGVYGIAIAAVGMLSTLGVTLATDAFGPVADNAGGIAEMAELPHSVRDTTDGLDALGNTTAATGKGFAIGSAVLTSLALLSAYQSEAEIYRIDVSQPTVLAATIIGACLPYLFAALTMMAVGRAASLMIEEVRRQFREYDLLNPDSPHSPDYQQCVKISTEASVIEMIVPAALAIAAPLWIGYFLGSQALGGCLIGGLTSGFMLAVFMANAGGAWDNAKKFIEADQLGSHAGKGSQEHKAAVVGDTIGDPFKDTSGPALNILIKLMTMMSLVFGSSFPEKAYDKNEWFIGIIVLLLLIGLIYGVNHWMQSTGFGKINMDTQVTSAMGNGTPQASAPPDYDAGSPSEDNLVAGAATDEVQLGSNVQPSQEGFNETVEGQ